MRASSSSSEMASARASRSVSVSNVFMNLRGMLLQRRRKFDPLCFNGRRGVQMPVRCSLLAENFVRSVTSLRIFPVESDTDRIRPGSFVDEMCFGAQISFSTIVGEANSNRARSRFRQIGGAIAKALGPEIAWLFSCSRDAPIVEQRLPAPARIDRIFNLIFCFR